MDFSGRGPFRLLVTRPGKRGKVSSEWLKGRTEADDVEEECQALLSDPKDTINTVNVWSERESQFIWGAVK